MTEFNRRTCLPARSPPRPQPRSRRLPRYPRMPRRRWPASRRRLLSLQARRFRAHLGQRRRAHLPLPDGFVRNVPKEQALAAAEAAYMPKGTVIAPFNPLRDQHRLEARADRYRLWSRHCSDRRAVAADLGGRRHRPQGDRHRADLALHRRPYHRLKTADGGLAFPNAEIKVPAVDWAFWMSDENMAKAPDGFHEGVLRLQSQDLRQSRRQGDDATTGARRSRPASPRSTASRPHAGSHRFRDRVRIGRLFFQCDVTNVPDLFLRNPDWHVMFDSEPEKAAQTRRHIYDMASAEKPLVSGYHFPFPGSAMSRRTAPAIGWCRRPGTR